MCLYLKNHSVNTHAIVAGFNPKNITLILPDYGLERFLNFKILKTLIILIFVIIKILHFAEYKCISEVKHGNESKNTLAI